MPLKLPEPRMFCYQSDEEGRTKVRGGEADGRSRPRSASPDSLSPAAFISHSLRLESGPEEEAEGSVKKSRGLIPEDLPKQPPTSIVGLG